MEKEGIQIQPFHNIKLQIKLNITFHHSVHQNHLHREWCLFPSEIWHHPQVNSLGNNKLNSIFSGEISKTKLYLVPILPHKLCSSCYNQVQVQEKYTLHALNTPLSSLLNPYKKITIRDFSVDLFLRNNIILKGLVTWI